MTELNLFILDERGLAHIDGHLSQVNAFCRALSSRIARNAGSVFTVAPAATPTARLYRFSEPGLLAENRDESRLIKSELGYFMPVESLKADQAQIITDLLRESPSRSCVVDDVNPEWDDSRRLYDLGQTAFGIGKEVYHWFDVRHGCETITSTLQQADAIWHGVSAVAECLPPANQPPTREWLLEHASRAIAVFCSAYDGEGFVGWQTGN